jgi:nucleotide-binding universal stress UspA family protein
MFRRRWLLLTAIFLGGLGVGVLLGLPLCPPTAEDARTWTVIGQGMIILLAIAIPAAYVGLMAMGAMSVTSPRSVLTDQVPAWVPETRRIDRVLVTAGGGANARLGLELAARIADDNNGHVTLLRVLAPEQSAEREQLESELGGIAMQTLGSGYPVTVLVTTGASVVDAVLAEAGRGYDLLVVGAAEQRPLRTWLFGAVPDLIARQAPCPVLVVRGGIAPA